MSRIPVVYTMGKVASSSVAAAIEGAGLLCHDIHTLNSDYIKGVAKKYLDHGEFPPRHICVSMAWRERDILNIRKCLYISLVRDPIARNLSAFFENHKAFLEGCNFSDLPSARKVLDNFINSYPHQLPSRWFDREYRTYLGIDVYKSDFDKSALFMATDGLIIFRVDLDDRKKSEVLSNALGRNLKIGRHNDGSRKVYADLYKAVSKLARFTPDFVDDMYGTPFVQHFWSADELRSLKSFWLGDDERLGIL